MTVVYIDSVFFLNALTDYLILWAASALAGLPRRRWRLLAAAALGGIYAVAVFLPGCGFLSLWPGKLAAGAALCAVAFAGCGKLIRLTLLTFAVACGFAGCVLGLGLLSGGVPMENGVFYTDADARVLLIAACAAYFTAAVVFRSGARSGIRGTLVEVTLAWGPRRVRLRALCDTGNTLQDPLTLRPLLVASGLQLAELWPPELRRRLSAAALRAPADALEELNRGEARFRLLPYSAVGVSGGLLLAFRSDWAQIGGKRYERLLVALSPTELGSGFAALWGGEGGEHGTLEKLVHGPSQGVGASGAAGASGRPLHRRRGFSAAHADPGAGGGSAGADRGAGRAADADRT